MRILFNYQNTKLNKEDLALTPFLFLISFNGEKLKVFGIGICWLYSALAISIGFGIPKKFPTFKILKK